jgi:alpha-glucoside transport system permease protein
MSFDFAAEAPKLTMLLYGIVAFLAIVGLLLLALDRVSSRKDRWIAAGFLAPAVVLLFIGLVIPLFRTILFSFMNGDSTQFVGLRNYIWMFTQSDNQRTLINTLLWVLLVPSVATSVGLLYAILVDKAKLESLAKALIFMPMAISFVGAGIIWKFVYAYRDAEAGEQLGLLNQFLVWMGATPVNWLLTETINTLLLIVVMIWIQAGFAMVVLSAAIKAIPAEITEAAKIDGVTTWQMFWRVTVPSIRPALVVVLVTISVATLKAFDIVRTMTNGNFKTSVLAVDMYNQAFVSLDHGTGSALAVFIFVLVTPIVFYQIRQIRRRRQEAM